MAAIPGAGSREASAAERQPNDGLLEMASAEPSFVGRASGRGVEIAQSYGRGAYDSYGSTYNARDYGYSYVPPFINPANRPRREPDNLTRDIDRSLAEINRTTAPNVEGGIQFRGRSGESGLDRLNEIKTPVKVNYSPGDFGTLTLTATPTFLNAGSVSSDIQQSRNFGTNALGQTGTSTSLPTPIGPITTGQAAAVAPDEQNAAGMGVSVGYAVGDAKIDIGTTPLGFEQTNVVGGVSYAPTIGGVVGLKATLERRAKTDSLLAYAGTTDERTGTKWGGVTRTGGRLDVNFDDGVIGAYINGAYYALEGQNVKNNRQTEFGFGTYYRLFKEPDEEMTLGVNLTYLAYDENLRHFSLGHGGYFSPQSYYAFSVPVEYTRKSGKTSYIVGGAIGVQNWNERRVAYFPNDPGLQSALDAMNAADPSIRNYYDGQDQTNLGLNVHGQVEYELSRSMALGASASFDSAADYYEATALVYLRHFFGQK